MKKFLFIILTCGIFLNSASNVVAMQQQRADGVTQADKRENIFDLIFQLFPDVQKNELTVCRYAVMDFCLYILLNSGDQELIERTLKTVSTALKQKINAQNVAQASQKIKDIVNIVLGLLEKEFDTCKGIVAKKAQEARDKEKASQDQSDEEKKKSEAIVKKQILKVLYRNATAFINDQDVLKAVIQSACETLAQGLSKSNPLRVKFVGMIADQIVTHLNSIGLTDIPKLIKEMFDQNSPKKHMLKLYGIFFAIDNGQKEFFNGIEEDIKNKTLSKLGRFDIVRKGACKTLFSTLQKAKDKNANKGVIGDFDKEHVFNADSITKFFSADRVERFKKFSQGDAQTIEQQFQKYFEEVVVTEFARNKNKSELEEIGLNFWKELLVRLEKE